VEELQIYLEPTPTIDFDTAVIREKAFELTKNQEATTNKAQSLFYFVRDQIKYSMYVPLHLLEHYKASTVLHRGEGYCVQKAVLMTTLARAIGIPTRLGFADIINHLLPKELIDIQGTNLFPYHGFVELYLNNRWTKVTPIFDLDMCEKNGIIPVDFDGTNDATFHPVDQDGKPHIEYLRYHGSFQDLPLDEILNAVKQILGQEAYELWMEISLQCEQSYNAPS